jgi:hypothetical protein
MWRQCDAPSLSLNRTPSCETATSITRKLNRTSTPAARDAAGAEIGDDTDVFLFQ